MEGASERAGQEQPQRQQGAALSGAFPVRKPSPADSEEAETKRGEQAATQAATQPATQTATQTATQEATQVATTNVGGKSPTMSYWGAVFMMLRVLSVLVLVRMCSNVAWEYTTAHTNSNDISGYV